MMVRTVEERDLATLIDLCAEHAGHERCSYERAGKHEKLHSLLFCAGSNLFGWVAERDGVLLGYATATMSLATWRAEPFMHMDCLFVRAAHRNQNIGTRLMLEVVREAQRRGIAQMQWQTPLWNVDADRFYRRLGAQPSEKYRYTLAVEDQACSWPASLALEGSRS